MTLHASDARTDLVRGTLDTLILRTLQWGPQHGYAIAQTIRAQSSDVLQVEAGSRYPPSSGSERRAGWRGSGADRGNQRAKFYRLTPEGKQQLLREESRWSELVAAIGRVMRAPGRGEIAVRPVGGPVNRSPRRWAVDCPRGGRRRPAI